MHNAKKDRLKPSMQERLDLADLIWEMTAPKSDDDIEAWFKPPWCDLGHALDFAIEAGGLGPKIRLGPAMPPPMRSLDAIGVIKSVWSMRGSAQKVGSEWWRATYGGQYNDDYFYERVHELRAEIIRSSDIPLREVLFIAAALESIAKWIARSDGGGHVYNEYLMTATRIAVWHGLVAEEDLAAFMLRSRTEDAVGSHPRLVAAFRKTWNSGRTSLAYLLAGRFR